MSNKYTFGEKTKEFMNGKELPVWQPPKYKLAKQKVIETLESDIYKNVLSEGDFWILMNTYSGGSKVMYSGLIISHNGCLKINDILDEKEKFNPQCVTWDKEGYNGSLICMYQDDDLFEVGEVSTKNCKNAYPYAMAFKRLFDRVVLKKCKLAYSGVYSDSEAEEFKNTPVEEKPNKGSLKEDKRIDEEIDVVGEINRNKELIEKGKKYEIDFTGKHSPLILKMTKLETSDIALLRVQEIVTTNNAMEKLIEIKAKKDEENK